jgi:hypothetical protein
MPWRTRIGGAIVGASLVALTVVPVARDVRPALASSRPRCNGHVELCARRYDQVAFAATHNSMRSMADGFTAPDQARSMAEQLDGGIRAFLIDVYVATPGSGVVCTDPSPLKIAQVARERGQAAVDQLLQVRSTEPCPAPGGPTAGLYLCHSFCELEAASFDEQLDRVRAFLREHPHDVVTLILEDYAPVDDILRSFRASGLRQQMVRHRPGTRWPTLAWMTKRGTRLVVFSQHQGGEAPGVLDAFREMNETPFTFRSEAELSCAPNRGPAEAPLFLLNHWIETADKRAAAQTVNDAAVLGARAARCADERAHLPNFVAVNFAEDGDLLAVVDGLNGVGSVTSPRPG